MAVAETVQAGGKAAAGERSGGCITSSVGNTRLWGVAVENYKDIPLQSTFV